MINKIVAVDVLAVFRRMASQAAACSGAGAGAGTAQKEDEAAIAAVAELIDTLAWYADAGNHYAQPGAGNPVRDDCGQRARRALAALQGETP